MDDKRKLQFRNNGSFRVLHLTDIQEGIHPRKDTLRLINALLAETMPDRQKADNLYRHWADVSGWTLHLPDTGILSADLCLGIGFRYRHGYGSDHDLSDDHGGCK